MSASTKIVAASLLGLMAAGCAQFTGDGGMAPVTEGVRREIGRDAVKLVSTEDNRRARERIQALLSEPLSEETAVQIALLNNRGLQAAYNDLGISEAEYVQASLPPNPAVTLSRTFGTAGFVEFALQFVGNLLAIATLPRRTEIAKREFEEARYRAVATTLSLSVDARRAWIRAVAARQRLALLEQARESADASARMMKQLGETGAASKLDQGRVAAFYAELSAQVAQARLAAQREREALTRMLGLWGGDLDYKLPARLAALPTSPNDLGDVEVEAMRRRVDLIILRYEIVTLARSVKFVEATRYLTFLELGGLYKNEVESSDSGQTSKNRYGIELGIVIPVFDTGEARMTTAREIYMRAVNRLAERSVNARSEARIAYATYRATYDIARYYQGRIVPLRRQISDEVLLRYNGMLIDVFEVLVDARERIAANVATLDALRDYYLADADLQSALIVGGTVPPSGVINTTPAPETIPLGL
jgi:outer membrane protein TolC